MKNYGSYHTIDPSYIFSMADSEEGFVITIINTFLETVPTRVQKLSEAVNTNNVEDIIFIAHTLKGSFRFIGSTHLANIIEKIEQEYKNKKNGENIPGLLSEALGIYTKVELELKELLSTIKS
ncbi:MAG TPA: Hpt domain-containing protein [Chitinophagaceae bacterium]|nr:Hpt domain-containing protein [Chitinophagaceae bacterium]